ncbi:MCE family protein [Gordonia sp. TBRC 11910]|uniref:MCE family protein n=1 Tax=Gordonia asplenii TaxID=2725283 RepID=A0A848KPY4_9ACTN|nr:MlaD family protein [Gordonia asplenii]NMO00736.1 MCE family protein [Gordonia asplenii]
MLRKIAGSPWLVSVGSIVIIALLGVGYFAVGKATTKSTTYCAEMHDAVGIFTGNTVTRRGVAVGEITGIDAGPSSAKVTFTVDGDQTLPADVKAASVSPSIIAVRQLALLGDYTGGARLTPGQCIGLSSTSTPVSISKSLESIAKVGKQLTSDGGPQELAAVMSSVRNISGGLAGTGPILNTIIKQLAVAPNTPITGGLADMVTVIDNVSAMSTGLADNWGLAQQLVSVVNPVLGTTIPALFDGVHGLGTSVPIIIQVIASLAQRYSQFVWPALDVVVPIARLIGAGMRNFGDLLGIVPVLIRAFNVSFDQRTLGVRIRYNPPKTRIPAKNPVATCQNINRIFPGQCHVSGPDGMEVDAIRMALILSGAAR